VVVVVVVVVVVAAAARVLEEVWWWCWWWQPLSCVVQHCDGDAPVRPPPTAHRRRQRTSGRTTAATAATHSLVGAQVGHHCRPNLLREHLFVLHLLTEACFTGPGEEVTPADDNSDFGQCGTHHGGSRKAAVASGHESKAVGGCKSCWQGS
jgi:hypothetical protein